MYLHYYEPDPQRAQRLARALPGAKLIDGVLWTWNDSPLHLFSHVNSYDMLVGEAIGLTGRLVDEAFERFARKVAARPLSFGIDNVMALLVVVKDPPGGSQGKVEL